jgi:replicative DNA helicase
VVYGRTERAGGGNTRAIGTLDEQGGATVSTYTEEMTQYNELANTEDGQALLQGETWKPLPSAPVAPPLRTEWLPPVLSSMSEAIAANLSVPPDLPALIGLGVASACACGRIGVQLKPDWYEPAQLFLLGVLDSGEGKTPAFRHMAGQLFKYQAEINKLRAVQIESDKAAMDVLSAKKQAAIKGKDTQEARAIAEEIAQFPEVHTMSRFIGGDVTPERIAEIMRDNDGATAQLDDEGELFELLAGRYQDLPNLNPWLKGYSGGVSLTMERKGGSTIVDNPNLSVLVLAQSYVLDALMDERRMRGKGMLARFLIAAPEPVREYGEEPDLPAPVVIGYQTHVRELIALRPAILKLTDEARELFFGWRNEIRQRQWTDWAPLKRDGYSGKLAGNTARLACILRLWEDSDTYEPIDALLMKNAIAFTRYFIGHMLHVIGAEGNLTEHAKETLALLIKNREPVQKERDLKRILRQRKLFPTDEAVDLAFSELEREGYIRRTQEQSGGRPTALVELHQDLIQDVQEVEF